MWENGTEKLNEVVQPPGTVLKQTLTPPPVPKGAQPNYILRAQLVLCAVLVALVLVLRALGMPAYDALRTEYERAMQQGVDLSGAGELVRFASSILDGVRIRAQEVLAGLEEEAEPAATNSGQAAFFSGAGGQLEAKKPVVPAGYSLKAYVPEQELAQPLSWYNVTSEYGWRKHPLTRKSDFHSGIDLATAEGTPISPAREGIVLQTGCGASYGNYVKLLHSGGMMTMYCHMQYVFVRAGELVTPGDMLGTVGSTGVATGPHLHFELLYEDVRYDPAKALGLE